MNKDDHLTFPDGNKGILDTKPKVYKDGKLVQDDQLVENLKGKTLEVYNFLVSNPGDHGVREIQRSLNYSSPSVVTYHLNTLIEAGIITKDVDNRYLILTNREKLGSFTNHIRIMEYWIPRSIVYGITTLFLVLSGLVLMFFKINSYTVWASIFLPILAMLTILLFYDGFRLSNRLLNSSKLE